MKKWKTLANPTDPTHWANVLNMWPTGRGSYEVADIYDSADSITATGEESSAYSVWCFNTLSGAAKIYYVGKYIWQLSSFLSSATATDRTGALGADACSGGGHACQYGDVTIVTRGTSASLISATTGNFAALAGSPSAKYVVVQSNAVVAFNTSANADEWVASDVGDYTNWTTGEAASGRILENNGPITGAIAYGGDIIVFKEDSIFRMTYVGGLVKWQIQKVWQGTGLLPSTRAGGSAVCATDRGLFFAGGASASTGRQAYFLFDGTSPPYQVNKEVTLPWGVGLPTYDPRLNMVQVTVTYSASLNYKVYCYYYQLDDDAWGAVPTVSSGTTFTGFPMQVRGEGAAVSQFTYADTPARPLLWAPDTGNNTISIATAHSAGDIVLAPPGGTVGWPSTAYIQTHKMSLPQNGIFGEDQTTFGPAAPILRRRTAYTAGTDSLALTVDTYTEAHDTSAAATASVTESTIRDRFDFTKSDSFCQLKLTATDTDIEIDDISVKMVPAGKL